MGKTARARGWAAELESRLQELKAGTRRKGGFYLCTLKKDATLLRTPQKLVVTYVPSLELFFSLTPFRRHLLLTVSNGSGE